MNRTVEARIRGAIDKQYLRESLLPALEDEMRTEKIVWRKRTPWSMIVASVIVVSYFVAALAILLAISHAQSVQ